MIRYLISKGFVLRVETFRSAALTGNLFTMQWLKMRGCPWDEWVFAYSSGYLEIMRWLRSNGCPWDSWTFSLAAHHGDLETLKWLKSEGCPMDGEILAFAASSKKGNSLKNIKWLLKQGCSWGEQTFSYKSELFSKIERSESGGSILFEKIPSIESSSKEVVILSPF